MDIYEQKTINGYRVSIIQDEDARNPRNAFENLGTMGYCTDGI